LGSLAAPKDVDYSHALDSDLVWTHRRESNTDIYFVVNHSDRARDVEIRFRVTGKEPELWHADAGTISRAEYSMAGGTTTVRIPFVERESMFVVFRREARSSSQTLPRESFEILASLGGPWTVTFPPELGAPPTIPFERLQSWTQYNNDGVK